MKNIIVAITGASGAIYGITALKLLRDAGVKTHLVISDAGRITISHETEYTPAEVLKMADYSYKANDIAACISSGSHRVDGMIITPCSAKSMGEIAAGIGSSLITRAADVTLKEGRRLALMVRETPLHAIHLENMTKLAKMGVHICPPMPAFYAKPANLQEMVTYSTARMLDLFDIDVDIKRWNGI